MFFLILIFSCASNTFLSNTPGDIITFVNFFITKGYLDFVSPDDPMKNVAVFFSVSLKKGIAPSFAPHTKNVFRDLSLFAFIIPDNVYETRPEIDELYGYYFPTDIFEWLLNNIYSLIPIVVSGEFNSLKNSFNTVCLLEGYRRDLTISPPTILHRLTPSCLTTEEFKFSIYVPGISLINAPHEVQGSRNKKILTFKRYQKLKYREDSSLKFSAHLAGITDSHNMTLQPTSLHILTRLHDYPDLVHFDYHYDNTKTDHCQEKIKLLRTALYNRYRGAENLDENFEGLKNENTLLIEGHGDYSSRKTDKEIKYIEELVFNLTLIENKKETNVDDLEWEYLYLIEYLERYSK